MRPVSKELTLLLFLFIWNFLDYYNILAAEKLRSIDSNDAINVRISFDGYGSRIRKWVDADLQYQMKLF